MTEELHPADGVWGIRLLGLRRRDRYGAQNAPRRAKRYERLPLLGGKGFTYIFLITLVFKGESTLSGKMPAGSTQR